MSWRSNARTRIDYRVTDTRRSEKGRAASEPFMDSREPKACPERYAEQGFRRSPRNETGPVRWCP